MGAPLLSHHGLGVAASLGQLTFCPSRGSREQGLALLGNPLGSY